MQPLVSVVVPTYNRAYCLPRTLDSALAQTHSRLEIILLDDGSTDDTAELVRARYGREPRVKYVHQANEGVIGARNHALRLVQGEYVAFLDSDDYWMPWKLQVQTGCLARFPEAVMSWTDMEAVGPSGEVQSSRYLRTMYQAYRWFPKPENLFTRSQSLAEAGLQPEGVEPGRVYVGDVYSAMLMGSLVHTSTVLFRRSVLERTKGFNPELGPAGEDYDFHLRTCAEGPVAFVDLASIRYQVGMADRLSRFTSRAAFNCLKTITSAVARDPGRITLPRRMLNTSLASVHGWVGEELYYAGDYREARKYLGTSLRYRPWQPRTAAYLALALLPCWLRESARFARRFAVRARSVSEG